MTLVKHSATSLLPHRIRVNLVNLGWMHTKGEVDIHRELFGRDESWLGHSAKELPFGKLIQPSEAAYLLTYLMTDFSVMTGSVIDFDQTVPGSGPTTTRRIDRLTP